MTQGALQFNADISSISVVFLRLCRLYSQAKMSPQGYSSEQIRSILEDSLRELRCSASRSRRRRPKSDFVGSVGRSLEHTGTSYLTLPRWLRRCANQGTWIPNSLASAAKGLCRSYIMSRRALEQGETLGIESSRGVVEPCGSQQR